MTLDELALEYGTDKSSTGHFYTKHYERIFGSIRMEVESMCEVGIGSGASLKMWRDYFQNAMIYGVDMEHKEEIGGRVHIIQSEQTDCGTLQDNLKDQKLEIIIEDASHDENKTMQTLGCLWPVLEPKGWYVIEDMNRHSFPTKIGEWYMGRSQQVRQLQILNNNDNGSAIVFIQKQR